MATSGIHQVPPTGRRNLVVIMMEILVNLRSLPVSPRLSPSHTQWHHLPPSQKIMSWNTVQYHTNPNPNPRQPGLSTSRTAPLASAVSLPTFADRHIPPSVSDLRRFPLERKIYADN